MWDAYVVFDQFCGQFRESRCILCDTVNVFIAKVLCLSCFKRFPTFELNYEKRENISFYYWLNYEGFVRDFWVHMKSKRQRRLAWILGNYVIRSTLFRQFIESYDEVILVPTTWLSYMKRGFYPLFDLCQPFATKFSINIGRELIKKTKSNRKQASLVYKERIVNVEGIYKVSSPLYLGIKYLVIDDIISTGSTLVNMVKSMKQLYPDISYDVFVWTRNEKKKPLFP